MKTINDELGLKMNRQWACDNCGATNDMSTAVCTECGNTYTASSSEQAASKDTAEVEGGSVTEEAAPKTPEMVLETVSTVVLWAGILVGVILFFIGKYMIDDSEEAIGYALLITIIPTVLSSVVVWAVLRVLCNISNNLNDINKKLNP